MTQIDYSNPPFDPRAASHSSSSPQDKVGIVAQRHIHKETALMYKLLSIKESKSHLFGFARLAV